MTWVNLVVIIGLSRTTACCSEVAGVVDEGGAHSVTHFCQVEVGIVDGKGKISVWIQRRENGGEL
jgi:hypothetical protein